MHTIHTHQQDESATPALSLDRDARDAPEDSRFAEAVRQLSCRRRRAGSPLADDLVAGFASSRSASVM